MTKHITRITHYTGAWGVEQASVEWTDDSGSSGITIGRPNNPFIRELIEQAEQDRWTLVNEARR